MLANTHAGRHRVSVAASALFTFALALVIAAFVIGGAPVFSFVLLSIALVCAALVCALDVWSWRTCVDRQPPGPADPATPPEAWDPAPPAGP